MSENKHRRFRLAIVNAAEDVPRLIRAYGRACFGEFALVLRPADGRGVMVRLTKEGAWMWRAGESDSPVLPDVSTTPKDAVTLVKTEQKAVPKSGPITLRGQWSGYLHCEDGLPRLELTRKLAAYGLLRLTSTPTGWTWTVERTAKWFSQPGSDSGTETTLLSAIQAGLARAMGLLGEACGTRDSHRRAALDESWAATHPIRPAKEGRDPTERLKPKEPRRTKAAAPPRMDAPMALPDAPATPAGVARMAEEVAQEADALASLRDVRWVWQDSTALPDAIAWFREAGLENIVEDLESYEGGPDHPPERLLEHVRTHLEEAVLDEPTKKNALVVLGRLEEHFRSAPYVLERARRLIRHAARLSETGLCRGQERKEAADAIGRAIHAYDEARAAVTAGATTEARTKVRSMTEWAALAAAKAARACAAGQAALALGPTRARPTPPPAAEPKPASKPRRRTAAAPTPSALGPSTSAPETPTPTPKAGRKPRRATPGQAPEPAAPLKATPRPRKAAAPSSAPEPEPPKKSPSPRKRGGKKGAVPEVDAEKDKLLLDAFREAVSAAMSEVGPE